MSPPHNSTLVDRHLAQLHERHRSLNSVRGVRVCRDVSERLGLHIFAAEDEDALLGAGGAAASA